MTVALPEPEAEDIGFRARALAQAHALSAAASSYRQWRLEREVASHPMREISDWAATAFLTGYCVHRVEQSYAGEDLQHPVTVTTPDNWQSNWEHRASIVAKQVLSGSAETLLNQDLIRATLEDVIGREIGKRHEHVREQLSPDDWSQFEAFVAWWVVHGYAICVIERRATFQ